MQEKSEKFLEFSERTEVLAKKAGLRLRDLPEKMNLSASMFHAYRSGKYPISPKAWNKLKAAEQAAGIYRNLPLLPGSNGNPNYLKRVIGTEDENSSVLRDDPDGYDPADGGKVAELENRIAVLEATVAAFVSAMQSAAGINRNGNPPP